MDGGINMSKAFVIPDIHLKPCILDEAEKYFNSDNTRKAYKTDYCQAKYGSGMLSTGAHPSFWLRTLGGFNSNCAFVEEDGTINYYGTNCNISIGIRPAIWIEID